MSQGRVFHTANSTVKIQKVVCNNLRALFTHIYKPNYALKRGEVWHFSWKKKKPKQGGKKTCRALTWKRRKSEEGAKNANDSQNPSRLLGELEESITGSSEGKLGDNRGGERAPDASVNSSAMKHSIVLQAPPTSLSPTQPQPCPVRLKQGLLWLAIRSVNQSSQRWKKTKKTLAARQHYKTNYGARRLSSFKVPSPFKTEWSKLKGVGMVVAVLVVLVVGASFKATPPPTPTTLHAPPIYTLIIIDAQTLGSGKYRSVVKYCTCF